MWSWKRLTKSKQRHVQITYGLTLGQGVEEQLKEEKKQEWAIEKPKPDHARDVRGNYSIHPRDEEYKDVIKNARRKLDQRQLQCHVTERFLKYAYGKPLFQKQKKPRHLKQRPDSVLSLKSMNRQDKE